MTDSLESTSDMKQQIHKLENSCKVIWRVNNFRSYSKVGELIESDTFNTNFGEAKQVWFLKMYPSGVRKKCQGYVSLFLECKSEFTVCFKLAILDQTEKEHIERSVENHTFSENDWGWSTFIKRDELFGENSKLLVNGALSVLCVITKSETEYVTHSKNVSLRVGRSTRRLSIDFGDLLKSSRLSDLTITVGERQLHAHRAILAARSPVFFFMEKSSGTLDIPDISRKTMEVLLNYIYTGECTDTEEVAEDLLRASDKYQLDELKDICGNILLNRITGDNASSLLALADINNAPELKEDVFEFVINNFKDVAISEGWKNLSATNPSLSLEVKDRVIERHVLKK